MPIGDSANIHAFWGSSFVALPAVQTLDAWANVVGQPPMHELVDASPPSHISSALRRVIDRPSQIKELEPTAEILSIMGDRREYVSGLLRFCVDAFADGLQRPDTAVDLGSVSSWMEDITRVLELYREGILGFKSKISEMNRQGLMPLNAGLWMLEVVSRLYSRLYRVRNQINVLRSLCETPPTPTVFLEIRRRLDWVLSLREFSRPMDWGKIQASRVADVSDRQAYARQLLTAFPLAHPDHGLEIFEQTLALGAEKKTMAFELERIVCETLERSAAVAGLKKKPERYDIGLSYYVHQFKSLMMPLRGFQGLLLGLWASGHELKVYTSADGELSSQADFFNDFPILKVAFNLVSPENPCELVSYEALAQSQNYADKKKWRAMVNRHFDPIEDPDVVAMVKGLPDRMDAGVLQKAKLPFPEFPFDVLVDSPSVYYPALKNAGFGNRWLGVSGSSEALLRGMKIFFNAPQAPVSDAVRHWLDVWSL